MSRRKERNERRAKRKSTEDEFIALSRPTIYPHAPKSGEYYLDTIANQHQTNQMQPQPELQRFEGAIHLGFILLVLVTGEILLSNIGFYGRIFFADLQIWYCWYEQWPKTGVNVLISAISALVPFILIKLFLSRVLNLYLYCIIYYLFQLHSLILPFYLMYSLTPMFQMISISINILYITKTHSYFATNLLLHNAMLAKIRELENIKNCEGNGGEIDGYQRVRGVYNYNHNYNHNSNSNSNYYPNNVNLSDYLFYVFLTPTLTYETHFGRTNEIRWRYVIKEIFGFCFMFVGFWCIFAQFIVPVCFNPSTYIIEDILKLALPSLICWLLMFYAIFHCYLLSFSEIFRFPHREFYKDWWNARSIGDFWRKWNLPVHEWCLRHIYIETIHYFHLSKNTSTAIVFLISALLHELIVGASFGSRVPYFFIGMVAQFPLILLNKMVGQSHRVGNILMWSSLLIGQPLLIVMYFRHWIKENGLTHYKDFWCAR